MTGFHHIRPIHVFDVAASGQQKMAAHNLLYSMGQRKTASSNSG